MLLGSGALPGKIMQLRIIKLKKYAYFLPGYVK